MFRVLYIWVVENGVDTSPKPLLHAPYKLPGINAHPAQVAVAPLPLGTPAAGAVYDLHEAHRGPVFLTPSAQDWNDILVLPEWRPADPDVPQIPDTLPPKCDLGGGTAWMNFCVLGALFLRILKYLQTSHGSWHLICSCAVIPRRATRLQAGDRAPGTRKRKLAQPYAWKVRGADYKVPRLSRYHATQSPCAPIIFRFWGREAILMPWPCPAPHRRPTTPVSSRASFDKRSSVYEGIM